jgi:hypothetical protein
MNNATITKTNDDAQSGRQKGIDKKKDKEPVDVATLEKSNATSGTDPNDPGPVAAGEASG